MIKRNVLLSLFIFACILCSSASALTYAFNRTLNGSEGSADWNNFVHPSGLYVHPSGEIYIADQGNVSDKQQIRVLAPPTYSIKQSIGGAWGTTHYFFAHPHGVYMYNNKTYVADTENNRIEIFGHSFAYDNTIGDSASSDVYLFEQPADVFVNEDGIYVSDTNKMRVLLYSTVDRTYTSGLFGKGDVYDADIGRCYGIYVRNGKLYIADHDKNRIAVFYTGNYTFITSIGRGKGGITLSGPEDVYVDAQERVFVADTHNNRTVVFDSDGMPLLTFGSTSESTAGFTFELPAGISGDEAGNIYVSDTGNSQIKIFSPTADAPVTTPVANSISSQEEISLAESALNEANSLSTHATSLSINNYSSVLSIASSKLAIARNNYQSANYTNATENAKSVHDDAVSAKTQLDSSISARLVKLKVDMEINVSTLKTKADLYNLTASTSEIEAELAKVSSYISAKNYASAISSYKSAEIKYTAYQKLVDDSAAQSIQIAVVSSTNATELKIAEVEIKLANYSGANKAELQIELTTARTKLANARLYLSLSNVTAADASLAEADALIASVEEKLAKAPDEITPANQTAANQTETSPPAADNTLATIAIGGGLLIVIVVVLLATFAIVYFALKHRKKPFKDYTESKEEPKPVYKRRK
ncbi:MAG: hypothetical protein ABIH99_01270 [Candidatus Micrarchaeota archaeon]